jgi:tetrapyrrole methylase family protein/MazG family protein
MLPEENSSQSQSASQMFFPDQELGTFNTLVDIVAKLRAPKGCPWDREQTHDSLKRNLLEESYEVMEAIDQGNPDILSEELGDLMVQVVFHADIAREAGDFQLEDVLRSINSKLIRRHPHVFGNEKAENAREVEKNWEQIKAEERQAKGKSKSPVEGIPVDLPALAYAQLMQDRVGKAGFEWDDISGVLDKLVEEVAEFRAASTAKEKEHELGDLLFTIVNLTRWTGAHAEDVLRQANQRFSRRYLSMESLAEERGRDFNGLTLNQKEDLWREAKKIVG